MGWGYTTGYPAGLSSMPARQVVPAPARRADDGRFDVAIVVVVVMSVLSLIGHAIPVYHWAAAAPSAVVVAAPNGGPTPSAAPTTTTPSQPTTTPTPSPAPPASTLPVPPTPVLDAVCLRDDNPRTGAKLPAGDPFGDDVRRLGSGAELQRLFGVQNGALVPLDGLGAPRKCDLQLWALVTTLAPTQVKHIEEFLLFDSANDSSGDGVKVGESAPKRVTSRQYDDEHWRLSLAPNRMDRSDVAWLVAHEVAHIASLNATQMMSVSGSCPTREAFTGCLSMTAYLERYLDKGWPDDLYRDWDRADASASSQRPGQLRKFFQAHRSSFITAYAATHPFEDFAESFAMWCTYSAQEPTRAQLPKRVPSDSGAKVEWFASLTGDLVPEFDPGCQAIRAFAAG